MPAMIKARSSGSPNTFFLTPKNLEGFGELRERAPKIFDHVTQLVIQSKDELFVPYFTQTPDDLLEFEFERFAYLFFPYRIQASSYLLQVLGSANFFSQYLKLLASSANRFAEAAPMWGLDQHEVSELFKTYFATAVRLFSLFGELPKASQEQQSSMLKAITKSDFGLTAVALAFEGTVFPSKSKVVRTFEFTRVALAEYVKSVADVLGTSDQLNPLAGSLKIEGGNDLVETPEKSLTDDSERENY